MNLREFTVISSEFPSALNAGFLTSSPFTRTAPERMSFELSLLVYFPDEDIILSKRSEDIKTPYAKKERNHVIPKRTVFFDSALLCFIK